MPFKFFKGCLPKILLDPLLNTLSNIKVKDLAVNAESKYAAASVKKLTRIDRFGWVDKKQIPTHYDIF